MAVCVEALGTTMTPGVTGPRKSPTPQAPCGSLRHCAAKTPLTPTSSPPLLASVRPAGIRRPCFGASLGQRGQRGVGDEALNARGVVERNAAPARTGGARAIGAAVVAGGRAPGVVTRRAHLGVPG